MTQSPAQLRTQLKNALRKTSAQWAVLAEHKKGVWTVRDSKQLPRAYQGPLKRYLAGPNAADWLYRTLKNGGGKSVPVSKHKDLKTARLFAFPTSGAEQVILVGAEKQSDKDRLVWRTLASSLWNGNRSSIRSDAFLFDLHPGSPYDLNLFLEHLLEKFARDISCLDALIAIRRGDSLDVAAGWKINTSDDSPALASNELIQQVSQTFSVMAVRKGAARWKKTPEIGRKRSAKVWVCVPLLVGKRLIGVLMFWRSTELSRAERLRIQKWSSDHSPSIEMAISFHEMSQYLRRLGLFNDFALTIGSAQNLDGIVRRVFDLLARTFGTDLISLYLLSTDGQSYREFYNQDRRLTPRITDTDGHPISQYINKAGLARLDHLLDGKWPFADLHGARSALIIPLKSRGQSVGALMFESVQPQAFKQLDEHLIGLMSAHLAGLVGYSRLREEAASRARNLGLVHEVAQQVIGLNDKREIAQITADLLARYFDYELTAVLLSDKQQKLTIHGFGGRQAAEAREAVGRRDISSYPGITGRVFLTGKSMLVNNTRRNKIYEQLEGWEAGSEVCVPLKENDRILGIIDVESSRPNAFTPNDLLAFESLAGILATVLSGAEKYQRLQETNRQLRQMQIELKARMEALRAAENKLVQNAKLAALGEMAAGIAHELNNPLTTVTGFAELVMEEIPEDANYRKELEMILSESRRAGFVIRRLLEFSRQGERTRMRTDVNELVEDAIALTQQLIRAAGVQLVADLGGEIPWLSVDRNQIKQVLLDLIHNALQAMPSGGKLYLSTAERSRDGRRWAAISVQDTGIGIHPKDRVHIFEPFFSTRSETANTGLGLSVAYGIIADHGGMIDVESEVNRGSTFIIWLPL